MEEKQLLKNNWVDNFKNPPLFIKKGNVGALLIHGFTANENTMKEMGDIFIENNITTLGVRLAGHGTSPADLNTTTYQDWVESAEAGLKRLTQETKQVYLVGYSLGGNISLYSAQKYPDVVKGIISLGTPIFLQKQIWIKIVLPFAKIFTKHIKKGKIDESEILQEYYKRTGSYKVLPLKAVSQLFKLIDVCKDCISQVSQPILIAHSRLDPSVNFTSANYIFNNIQTPEDQKELFLYDDTEHILISQLSQNIVRNKINNFIQK
jgi:carboxylesterase